MAPRPAPARQRGPRLHTRFTKHTPTRVTAHTLCLWAHTPQRIPPARPTTTPPNHRPRPPPTLSTAFSNVGPQFCARSRATPGTFVSHDTAPTKGEPSHCNKKQQRKPGCQLLNNQGLCVAPPRAPTRPQHKSPRQVSCLVAGPKRMPRSSVPCLGRGAKTKREMGRSVLCCSNG